MKETKTASIRYYGENCELQVRTSPDPEYARKRRGSRIYVEVPWSPEELPYGVLAMKCPPPSVKGEDPANDKAWKRYNKIEVGLQQTAIQFAVQQGLLSSTAMEAKWSRKAGCACGCSPGWIWKDRQNIWSAQNIWIEIKSPKKEAQRERDRKDYQAKREMEAPTFSI